MGIYLHQGELPRLWLLRTPYCKNKMSNWAANKLNTFGVPYMDDIDARWNTTLTNFEAKQVDGQESSSYDKFNPGDEVAIAQNQMDMAATIKTTKACVSKLI